MEPARVKKQMSEGKPVEHVIADERDAFKIDLEGEDHDQAKDRRYWRDRKDRERCR